MLNKKSDLTKILSGAHINFRSEKKGFFSTESSIKFKNVNLV